MADLWLILLPILLTDVANPVLFGLLVYLAGTDRGVLMSSVALLGHTAAYFSAGVVIAFAFNQITAFVADPGPVSFGIGFLVGCLLLWVAWLSRGTGPGSEPENSAAPTIGSAFMSGAIVNFIGIPFALPYFAAIDQILKTDLDTTGALLTLGAYNLAYLTPFLVVPLLTAVMGGKAQAILSKINERVERFGGVLLPVILGAFLSGEGLF
jgi:cytochrome c biogenesis protein CcdA